MSDLVEAPAPPSLLAHGVAHVLIGLTVGALTRMVFRQRIATAIMAGVIAAAAHYNFDAPVARRLSDLGI